MPRKKTEPKPEVFGELRCKGSAIAAFCNSHEDHKPGYFIYAEADAKTSGGQRGLWAACFLCGGEMGCPECATSPICGKCIVVTDKKYFVQNGPISNDRFSVRARGGKLAPHPDNYPDGWVMEYYLKHPQTAVKSDQELFDQYEGEFKQTAAAGRFKIKSAPGVTA